MHFACNGVASCQLVLPQVNRLEHDQSRGGQTCSGLPENNHVPHALIVEEASYQYKPVKESCIRLTLVRQPQTSSNIQWVRLFGIYPVNRISVQGRAALWKQPHYNQIRNFLALTIYMKGLRSKNSAAPMVSINILVLDQNKYMYSLILRSKEFAYTYQWVGMAEDGIHWIHRLIKCTNKRGASFFIYNKLLLALISEFFFAKNQKQKQHMKYQAYIESS